jgi:hypothetical protein
LAQNSRNFDERQALPSSMVSIETLMLSYLILSSFS